MYDPERHLAHSLNRAALAVWKHCSGHNSVTELRRLVAGELGVDIDESAIWLALRRLDSAHLLVGTTNDFNAISRRQVLRTAGRIRDRGRRDSTDFLGAGPDGGCGRQPSPHIAGLHAQRGW